MLTTALWYIVVGAVIGVVAWLVVPGRNPIGMLSTILVGIGGVIATSLGGGYLIAFILAVAIAAVAVALLTNARAGGRVGGRSGWRRRRRAM